MDERQARTRARSVVLALAALIALNEPLLGLVSGRDGATVLGFPPLFGYVFVVWAIVIAAQFAIARSTPPPPGPGPLPVDRSALPADRPALGETAPPREVY